MKMWIAHCRFSGGEVLKFRVQAQNAEGLEMTVNAIAAAFTKGRLPEKVEFKLCPIQTAVNG